MMRRNGGFLLVTAIVILVVLSIVAVVLTRLSENSDSAADQDVRGAQALYIADAGLNEASLGLLTPTVYDPASTGNRQSCATIAANLTNVPVGAGMFAVTGTLYAPGGTTAPVTVNGALGAPTASNPTPAIPFTGSAAAYAPAGRIMIDSEEIDYSAISASSTTCGTVPAPCFAGVMRGVDGTVAVAHAGGTPIAQYQCTVQSQGGVPGVAAPRALRTLTGAIQLQGGWAVGSEDAALLGTPPRDVLQWQSNAWIQQLPPGNRLNAVTCTSYADCWAVGSADLKGLVGGAKVAPVATALQWNGQAWTAQSVPAALRNHDLDGVACISYGNCWMVGAFTQTGNRRWTLLHWTGTFTSLAPSNVLAAPQSTTTLSNKTYLQYDIDGVACASADQCFAVGSLGLAFSEKGGRLGGGPSPTLLLAWNGAAWALDTKALPGGIAGDDLDAITCLPQGCWAVGSFGRKKPVAVYWDAANGKWTADSPTKGRDLESIACVTVSDCWAGGSWATGKPVLEHWNGTAWADVTPAAAAADIDGLSCLNANDCWAVGSMGSGTLQLLHWNGAAWTNLSADIATRDDLEGIYLIGSRGAPQAAWQETFP